MQRLNKLIAWISFTALALPSMAQEQHAFSLQQAVDYGKKNNVQVKNALLGIQLQQQQNREITAAAYPIKVARELGLERRETVRSLSAVGVGDLRRAVPSTRGPGWTHLWCTDCRASGTVG